jgi:tellurite resistance protein TerC
MIKEIIKELEPEELFKRAKKWIIFGIGMSILLIGISMIILPGPAIIVIPLGLAILGTEFVWAKRFLKKIKKKMGLK